MKMRSIEIVFCITLITVCLIGCATPKTDEAKRNRERVNNLIQVGDQILEAQHILTEEGFTLVYEEPIHPTGPEDYLQQLVVIGDTRHSEKLISGSHTFAHPRHRMLFDTALKLFPIQKIDDLRENETASVHPLLRMNLCQFGHSVQMRDNTFSLLAA